MPSRDRILASKIRDRRNEKPKIAPVVAGLAGLADPKG